jgi:hypothetical protein
MQCDCGDPALAAIRSGPCRHGRIPDAYRLAFNLPGRIESWISRNEERRIRRASAIKEKFLSEITIYRRRGDDIRDFRSAIPIFLRSGISGDRSSQPAIPARPRHGRRGQPRAHQPYRADAGRRRGRWIPNDQERRYPASSAPMSKAPPSGTGLPKKSRVPVVQPVRPAQGFVPWLIAGEPACSVHWVPGLPIPS